MDFSIDQIIEGIKAAAGDKRTGRRWVSQFIFSMSPEDLAFAVRTNLDPWSTAYVKYHLDHPIIARLARGLLREYWNGNGGIEESLIKVENVAKRLARNPNNRELLKKPETIDWLNRAVTHAYNQMYDFVWGSQWGKVVGSE